MKTVLGYNIILRVEVDDDVGGTIEKTFAGTTSNDFNITPEVKESITKADMGSKKRRVTGYGFDFSVSGLISISETGDPETSLDNEEIVDLTLAGGEHDFIYGGGESGDTVRKGKFIISGYSESTDSENEGTYSLNCIGNPPLTKETLA